MAVQELRDVAYGPHERNVLDIWLAEGAGPSPVYVMIYGSGSCGGDKSVWTSWTWSAC